MFPLLDCPREILRNLVGQLDLPSLKNLRLTCRTLGELGAATLLPSVVVVFTIQSFLRLRDISLHPIFSLRVREIIYQPDRLDFYSSQDEWQRRIYDPAFVRSLPRESFEELQAMPPGDPMKVYHGYSQERLNTGWEKYNALFKEQTEICRREIDKRELGLAIMVMPRLEEIVVDVGWGDGRMDTPYYRFSAYFVRSYREMLVPPRGENSLKDDESPGYRHFLPLLVPFTLSDKYDIKALQDEGSPIAETLNEQYRVSTLNRIFIAGISWQALRQLEPRMPVLPRALAQVKALALSLDTHDMFTNDIEDCAHYLRESGALHKFLSACPSLTHLNIALGVVSAEAASLDDVVGKTTWKSLCQIKFICFKLPAAEFCSFLQRHQDTLRDVVLENMCVERLPETWATLLAGVRALNIHWKHFRVLENLHQVGIAGLSLYIDSYPPMYSDGHLFEGKWPPTGPDPTQMIEDYVTKKTDFDPTKTAVNDEATGDTIWHTEVVETEV